MVLVVRRAVLPERDVLRLRRTEAVKVDRDVCAAVCREAHYLVYVAAERGRRRVGLSALELSAAEPVVVVDREADAVCVPFVYGDDRRLDLLVAVRDRLHPARVHALEPHLPPVGVDKSVADDPERLRPLLAALRLVGDIPRLFLALALRRRRIKRLRIDLGDLDVFHLHLARLRHEEARHDDKLHGIRRDEERRRLSLPAVRVLLDIARTGRILELLAVRALELEEHAGVEPRPLARLEVPDFPHPGNPQRLHALGQIVFPVGVDQLAGLFHLEIGVQLSLLGGRGERTGLCHALAGLRAAGGPLRGTFAVCLLPRRLLLGKLLVLFLCLYGEAADGERT